MPTFPSLKSLRANFPNYPLDTLREVRKYGKAKRSELESHPAGAARVNECYHPPKTHDLRMTVLDAIMGTHGIEHCYSKRDDQYDHCTPAILYLNTGDSYNATIIRSRGGRYYVGSWGDWAERNT